MFKFTRRRFLGYTAALPVVATIAQSANAATTHTVEMRGSAFRPRKISIAVGDTIDFVNKDSIPHTADSRNGWKTGNINGGQTKSITFNTAGTSNYTCRYHSSMEGKVIVS